MVFPSPLKARYSENTTELAAINAIRIDRCFSERLFKAAGKFASEYAGCFSKKLPVYTHDSGPRKNSISLAINPSLDTEQWYAIRITDTAVSIEASGEAGAFYGMTTLGLLIETYGPRVPCCTIEDRPDFLVRGVMLDISRCKVPTMKTLKSIVELLAVLKFNQVQLYTEHTYAFAEHETVWKDASPLTADDIRELDDFCCDRYIELVPNLNSFGHFERWLCHPEYRHLAESPRGFEHPLGGRSDCGSTLKPDRTSLQFLDLLYGEFLPNFTSRLFNVGCDETWELGAGWSRKRCEKRGAGNVYVSFLKKIHKLVKKYGHRMMFWGDIILKEPELIPGLPKDLIALCWGYEADHPFNKECARFAGAGIDFYVCPGTSSWNSLTGRTGNCLRNCAAAARNGKKHGASGYLITDWGDHGHHQYWPVSYTGIFAGAAYSWCFATNKDADIAAAINRIAVNDATGRTGKCIFDLGKVLELVPVRLKNRTVFNTLLFSRPGELGKNCKGITKRDLKKSIRQFDKMEKSIAQIRPQSPDRVLIRQELTNAVRMARFGARRGLAHLEGTADLKALRRECEKIITQHKKLWLKRNRPGGLDESAGMLEKVRRYLQ
ncbi:MAG: family 20 glycosylhydrolase [Chitinivibrionales bacterium]|nr:family 20 glycosylhydrolase [Chitinivibrionales bacterium]